MDDAVDALFALAPSDFTAARNGLVKQLRAEKRREEADAVKSLKRPTVAAWAVNQVARAQPALIEAVVEGGAAVGAAQRRALSGVRESGLRVASQRRRNAIDEVWRAAAAVLGDAGIEPGPHRRAVAATLEAASVDSAAAELVRRGRLGADLPAPSGFGDVAGFTVVAEEAAPAEGEDKAGAPEPDDTAAREALAAAQQRAEQARRRAKELADRVADARRAALRTADEAQRLERRAGQVRGRAQEEAAAAEALATAADDAQREAEAAAAVVRRSLTANGS